jgi:hypothetical protein
MKVQEEAWMGEEGLEWQRKAWLGEEERARGKRCAGGRRQGNG